MAFPSPVHLLTSIVLTHIHILHTTVSSRGEEIYNQRAVVNARQRMGYPRIHRNTHMDAYTQPLVGILFIACGLNAVLHDDIKAFNRWSFL